MEIWSEIRREVLTGALSKRAAIAKYGIAWHTLNKILTHDEPPGYRHANQRPKPKLDRFLPVIQQILVDDGKALLKQKHTARRIFERLRKDFNARDAPFVIATLGQTKKGDGGNEGGPDAWRPCTTTPSRPISGMCIRDLTALCFKRSGFGR